MIRKILSKFIVYKIGTVAMLSLGPKAGDGNIANEK